MNACEDLPEDAFVNPKNNRFNIALFEAVFTATCTGAFSNRKTLKGKIEAEEIAALEKDAQFVSASLEGTTRTTNVATRLQRARALITAR